MPIKYGEVTIFHSDKIPILENLAVFLFGSERNATEESKFVFLFEDGEIYDIDDLKDFKFHFLEFPNKSVLSAITKIGKSNLPTPTDKIIIDRLSRSA